MNNRGLILHIADSLDSPSHRFVPEDLVRFYAAVFSGQPGPVLFELTDEQKVAMAEFAARHAAPRLPEIPKYTPTARDRRLARRGRTIAQIMGAAVVLLSLSGCARMPMVRECGAVVGSHFDAESFSWVQPCDRGDRRGVMCEETCRRARTACEADQAAYRDERLRASPDRERIFHDLSDALVRDCK